MDKTKLIKYTKNIGTYFSASLIPMILNLLANPLIAMNMSPDDFAIVGYYSSFSTLLLPLITFYFLHYYNKRYFESNEEERVYLKAALFKLLTIYSVIAALICLLGVFFYIKLFNSNIQFGVFPYLPLAILSLPLTGIYNLELTDYKMQKNSNGFFKLSVTTGVINTVAVLIMVVVLRMAAFGKMLAPFCVNLGIFIYLVIKHHELWKVRVTKNYIYDIFKFCWPLALAEMLGYFTNGFDKTFLESVGDVTEYGYYCVASSMAAYLYVFSTTIYNTFTPDVYEAISNHNNIKLFKTFGIELAMNAVVVTVFIVFCPIIIYILTAGRYMESIPYARVLSFATLFQTFYYSINCFTIAKGYTQLTLFTKIIGSIFIVVSMYVFVRNWSFMGGAWVVSLSSLILFGVNLILILFAAGKSRSRAFFNSLMGEQNNKK